MDAARGGRRLHLHRRAGGRARAGRAGPTDRSAAARTSSCGVCLRVASRSHSATRLARVSLALGLGRSIRDMPGGSSAERPRTLRVVALVVAGRARAASAAGCAVVRAWPACGAGGAAVRADFESVARLADLRVERGIVGQIGDRGQLAVEAHASRSFGCHALERVVDSSDRCGSQEAEARCALNAAMLAERSRSIGDAGHAPRDRFARRRGQAAWRRVRRWVRIAPAKVPALLRNHSAIDARIGVRHRRLSCSSRSGKNGMPVSGSHQARSTLALQPCARGGRAVCRRLPAPDLRAARSDGVAASGAPHRSRTRCRRSFRPIPFVREQQGA